MTSQAMKIFYQHRYSPDRSPEEDNQHSDDRDLLEWHPMDESKNRQPVASSDKNAMAMQTVIKYGSPAPCAAISPIIPFIP